MSFLKYRDKNTSSDNERGPLHFGRTAVDGLPFRGAPVLLRDDEYQKYTEVVHDADIDIFDMGDPAQRDKLREIVDRSVNQWYVIYRMQEKWVKRPDGSVTILVYVVWSVPQRELAKHRLPPELNPATTGAKHG